MGIRYRRLIVLKLPPKVLDYFIQEGDDATEDDPPNAPEFQASASKAVDRRRREASGSQSEDQSSSSNSSSIDRHLGTVARLLLLSAAKSATPEPAPSPASAASSSRTPMTSTAQNRPPCLSLDEFCSNYQLSSDIKAKLHAQKITGPHALRFVNDEQLLGPFGLAIGELADVRDAFECWSLSSTST